MENKKQQNENRLYYNIQAIEICKKYNVEYKYSTSKDLTKDTLTVENVKDVIDELKALNCWTSIRRKRKVKTVMNENSKQQDNKIVIEYVVFRTDVKQL